MPAMAQYPPLTVDYASSKSSEADKVSQTTIDIISLPRYFKMLAPSPSASGPFAARRCRHPKSRAAAVGTIYDWRERRAPLDMPRAMASEASPR